jgi:bacillolysin
MSWLRYWVIISLCGASLNAFAATGPKGQGAAKITAGSKMQVSSQPQTSTAAAVYRIGQRILTFAAKFGIAPAVSRSSTAVQSTSAGFFPGLPLQVQPAVPVPPKVIRWNESLGTPRYMEFSPSSQGKATAGIPTRSQAISKAASFLETNKSLLKIHDPVAEFSVVSVRTDKHGFTHVRYQQKFQGVEVWAKDIYVHINGKGEVESFNGVYAQTPSTLASVSEKVTSTEGIATVQSELKGKGYTEAVPAPYRQVLKYNGPSARKVVWLDRFNVPHLAWFVEVRTGIDHDWYYFVDAISGRVLRSYDNVDHDGATSSSGTDLNGVTRSFGSYQTSGTYYMIDTAEPMYDAAHSQIPNNAVGAIATLDLKGTDLSAQSQFYFVTSTNNTWSDPSTVSAEYNAAVTYNYYRTVFGRNSIDDSGMTIYSIVHVTENGQSMENAFWNGGLMAYGDGGQVFKPLAGGIDVAAHEMTHGVTQHSANLEYVDQSGALNESMSDAFAVMVDTLNWTIGETVVKDLVDFPTGSLRDMADPHNGGSSGSASWQPANMGEFVSTTDDNGGVHTNSGIPNHALYLVATSIGRTEASRIWYRALTDYLTRSSQFVDARIATVQAAADLYGASSGEVTAVKNAWSSVGVTDSVGSAPPPVSTITGANWLLVTNTDPNDPNSLYMARTTISSNSDFSPLSTTTVLSKPAVADNGSIVIFVDGDHNLRALATDASNPQETILDTSGVWGSVAIGPGLSSIALTSKYIDTTIYYLDLTSSVSKSFKIVTQSYDGPGAKTALYADEMSFDPSGQLLLFDSYNEIPGAQGDTLSYWNIDLLNVASGTMVNVFPPQSTINLANPAFSKTSTYRFTFDYWDNSTSSDYVMAADFNTGNSGIVAGPQNVLGYPSYSADDDTIAYHTMVNYQSALHDGIEKMPLQSDLLTGTGASVSHTVDATFPVWFIIGTRATDVKDGHQTVPNSFSLMQNYPNPFNPSTSISYQLSAASDVNLTVFDVLGRKVATLVNGRQNAGVHTAVFEGGNLPSGVYFCRLSSIGREGTVSNTAVRKMVLLK